MYDLIVIGGGPAGLFAAITASNFAPKIKILVLEKSGKFLSKLLLSGGGRCNLTHACFNAKELAQKYPRGAKELIGPFYQFQPQNTIAWFEERNIQLKVEQDGRVFPQSNSSHTIADALLKEAKKNNISLQTHQSIQAIHAKTTFFEIFIKDHTCYRSKHVLLATGSSSDGYRWAKQLGHTIITPIPALFSLRSPDFPLKTVSGVSKDDVEISIDKLKQRGACLITHFGFSGPALLKLSSFAARHLYEREYHTTISINWTPDHSEEELYHLFLHEKSRTPHKRLFVEKLKIPRNLWNALLHHYGYDPTNKLHDLPLKQLRKLAYKLKTDLYPICGRSDHKQEFVTCGGIPLKEIDCTTMQSKQCKDLFFAGEILDIDGVTGGFNLQNAWTTGYIAGKNSACAIS